MNSSSKDSNSRMLSNIIPLIFLFENYSGITLPNKFFASHSKSITHWTQLIFGMEQFSNKEWCQAGPKMPNQPKHSILNKAQNESYGHINDLAWEVWK